LAGESIHCAVQLGRRRFFATIIGMLAASSARAQNAERRFRIAFANLSEDPSVRLEGLGFTGLEVRRSFELASAPYP